MDKYTQEWIDAGNDILKSVSKAIDKNDYSKLADEITKTIKSVSIERKTTYASGVRPEQTVRVVRKPAASARQYPFFFKKVGKYDGFISAVAGAFWGTGMLGVAITMLSEAGFVAALPFAALTAFFGWLTFSGFKKLKLSKAFYKYGNILKFSEYFAISDLAKAAMESDEEVLKNIKAMIKDGYLPRAKLDSTQTTCMITDAAYQMYLGAEQDRLAREQREANERAMMSEPAKPTDKVEALLAEGREYINFVRYINDIIPDTEEMSNKLYKLESIMNKIFEQVKKDPDSADDLHKFMDYYLPTTKKLLSAYVELDKQGNGENVAQTKKEIDSVMDTINEAFENLLDSLFQEMAWDISSDISVMKTMMAQDGLTSDGMAMTAQGGMAMAAQPGVQLEFDKK